MAPDEKLRSMAKVVPVVCKPLLAVPRSPLQPPEPRGRFARNSELACRSLIWDKRFAGDSKSKPRVTEVNTAEPNHLHQPVDPEIRVVSEGRFKGLRVIPYGVHPLVPGQPALRAAPVDIPRANNLRVWESSGVNELQLDRPVANLAQQVTAAYDSRHEIVLPHPSQMRSRNRT